MHKEKWRGIGMLPHRFLRFGAWCCVGFVHVPYAEGKGAGMGREDGFKSGVFRALIARKIPDKWPFSCNCNL